MRFRNHLSDLLYLCFYSILNHWLKIALIAFIGTTNTTTTAAAGQTVTTTSQSNPSESKREPMDTERSNNADDGSDVDEIITKRNTDKDSK